MSVGREPVTVAPPIGDEAVGAPIVVGLTTAAARCVIVKLEPAMVNVPLRSAVAVLAATVNCAVPLPLPLAPWLIVMKVALLAAVQLQPVPAVTATVAVPPSGPKLLVLGAAAVTVQLGAAGFEVFLEQAPA